MKVISEFKFFTLLHAYKETGAKSVVMMAMTQWV